MSSIFNLVRSRTTEATLASLCSFRQSHNLVRAQLRHYFHRSLARLIGAVGREGDRTDTRMAPTTIAFADGRKIHHVFAAHFRPRVRSDGNLGAEAGFAETDGIDRFGVQIIGNKLVVALKLLVRDIEINGAVDAFAPLANQLNGLLVFLKQRSLSTSSNDSSVSSGINLGMNALSCVDSIMSVSFIAAAAISTADSALVYKAPSTISAHLIRSATGAASKPNLVVAICARKLVHDVYCAS